MIYFLVKLAIIDCFFIIETIAYDDCIVTQSS